MFVYYYCFLAVLVLGLICSLMVRRVHREEPGGAVAPDAHRPGVESGAAKTNRYGAATNQSVGKEVWEARERALRLERELHSVRVPWGWPKHSPVGSKRKSGPSNAMKWFSDRVANRKTRLERKPARSRSKENLRAFIEDRYVPAKWNSPSEIAYRKVKPPLLRDPNAPHDQMDNFGIKPAELVRKKLQRVVKMDVEAAVAAEQDELRYVNREFVKQPWGW